MYTIIDERLDQQLLQPIIRKQPKETCARTRTAPGQSGPEPFEPWKVPFIDEQEWQLFLKTMLDELRNAPVEARNIFNAMLRAVTERINQR